MVQPTDSEHRGYYEAARQGRLVVQRCAIVRAAPRRDRRRLPVLHLRRVGVARRSAAGATIYSYQIVTQAIQPAFADWVPYPVVLVSSTSSRPCPGAGASRTRPCRSGSSPTWSDRDDPTRPEAEENVAIGRRVEVCFVDLGDDFAIRQFRLSEPAS